MLSHSFSFILNVLECFIFFRHVVFRRQKKSIIKKMDSIMEKHTFSDFSAY